MKNLKDYNVLGTNKKEITLINGGYSWREFGSDVKKAWCWLTTEAYATAGDPYIG